MRWKRELVSSGFRIYRLLSPEHGSRPGFVADDEDLMKEGKAVDLLELKARKAQFALSIYELGVSHMNGWGIEQDKVLALRCFEIAGGKSSIICFCPILS